MNNTLRNGFRVLEILASEEKKLSVKRISDEMGVPKSNACRLLKTLAASGYVEQDESTKCYGISLKILALSNLCLTKNIVRKKARPFIAKLSRRRQIDAYLSVTVGNKPMVVDAVYLKGARAGDSASTIGSYNSIHCSATGKVAAAFHPEADLDEFLEGCSFERKGPRTITSKDKFIETLPEIRARKIALAVYESGSMMVAAASPIFDNSEELAGIIGILLPNKADYEHDEIMKYAEDVRATAEAVSFSLGYADYEFV